MSFRCAATARSPIRSNCWRRLSFGFIVASVGKLIVGLQVMWADFKAQGLGMAAQIQRKRHGVIGLAQQEGHRRGAWRVSFKRLADGASHRSRAVAIKQVEQVTEPKCAQSTCACSPANTCKRRNA